MGEAAADIFSVKHTACEIVIKGFVGLLMVVGPVFFAQRLGVGEEGETAVDDVVVV
jgi:hypothetical protein